MFRLTALALAAWQTPKFFGHTYFAQIDPKKFGPIPCLVVERNDGLLMTQ
jgi:hypothetical protein